MKRILIVILAYNAGRHIAGLLARLPARLFSEDAGFRCDILLLDDASADDTLARAREYVTHHALPIRLLRNPVNQRYGGNQKIGYTYAIRHGYDIALMLHGDGQYPPEMIEDLLAPLLQDEADAVLGSRMMNKRAALDGGMPCYKFLGNIALTQLQNRVLGSRLSEFHSGFRAYSLSALATLPFTQNSNDFDFDTDILIQFIQTGKRIREIPIPTHYGDEVCHVNGLKYAFQVIRNSLLARCQRLGIFYRAKFDFEPPDAPVHAHDKTGFASSQSWAIARVPAGSRLLEIRYGHSPHVAAALAARDCSIHTLVARPEESLPGGGAFRHADPARPGFALHPQEAQADALLLLDVVEHLDDPEACMRHLHRELQSTLPRLYLTTGNIGFFMVRLSLLFGQFNYGRHGILDRTHKRLFTFASLRRLLETQGYQVERMEGIPAPFPLAIGNRRLANALLALNTLLMRISRSWFAYQIAVTARPLPRLEQLIRNAEAEEA